MRHLISAADARKVILKRARLTLLIALFGSLVLPLPTHGDNAICPATVRLAVGSTARIAYGRGELIDLHEYPAVDGRSVGSLPEGTTVTVLRGPVCADGTRWWQVRALTGTLGWTRETTPGGSYVIEAWQILLDSIERSAAGFDAIRINERGLSRALTSFVVNPIGGTVRDVFPPHEALFLREAFEVARTDCPDRLRRGDPLYAGLTSPDALPADLLAAVAYISPDATRLIVVRHLWHSLIRCDGTRTPFYGLDRVSLIAGDGEHLLFDIPANASIPGFIRADGALNRVADVIWSPDNHRVLMSLRYGDRARLMLYDTGTGALDHFDDGAFPVWTVGGAHVEWLHTVGTHTNLQIARADGADRQTIALPDSLQFVDAPIAPTWSEDGSWLLACDRASKCGQVVVMNVAARRALPPLRLPIESASGVRWVGAGDAPKLLWIPRAGGILMLQSITDGTARPLTVTLNAGEHIEDARVFPGDDSALVIVSGDTSRRFSVLNLVSGLTLAGR